MKTSHWRKFGAIYILFGMAVATTVGYWAAPKDTKTEGLLENLQSEWWQLFVQAILIVAMAAIIFHKSLEDIERIEAKVDTIADNLGIELGESE